MSSVAVVRVSENDKTGKIACTYVGQRSCPHRCPLKGEGCYAESGYVGFITCKLNKSVDGPVRIAQREAKGIRGLLGDRPLRLHVVGDCATSETARIVSSAAEEYMLKHNQPVWTYTHGRIPREAWGKVSVLRSCHSLRQAEVAFAAGFAAAIVVKKFKSNKAYYIGRGMTGIPCPAQTKDNVTCDSCRLCAQDKYLIDKKMVILLEVHGVAKKKATEHAM